MADDIEKRAFAAIAMAAAAAYFGSVTLQDYVAGTASEHWLPTPAIVLSSNTSYKMYQRGFSPNIAYRYAVGGTTYTSERICFPSPRSSSALKDAYRFIEAYPPKKRVVAYYDPKNPENSCLQKHVNSDGLQHWLLLTGLFTLLAIIFAGAAFRKKLSDDKPA